MIKNKKISDVIERKEQQIYIFTKQKRKKDNINIQLN